jgi:YidC/Oxa1 family membrane protein insertase
MNFDFLFESFGTVLAELYELRHSYAFMIIGLTLIVMVVVTPLTLKATRSMLMMQKLQPEMKKLQSQYKDDRQKLNEELLKFYRENNINPVGGCLPLLVQAPVFLVLYQVLRGLNFRVPTTGGAAGHVSGQTLVDATLTEPVKLIHTFSPRYLPTDSELYANLSSTSEMRSIGLDLARSASEEFSADVIASLPYLLLIALVAITGVVQQRQIQSRSSGMAINPQQQAIMKIMPFFLPVFSFALPAGLVLYFVVSNTYRVGQQWFISRNIYGKQDTATDGGDGTGDREPSDASPPSSGGQRGRRRGQEATAPETSGVSMAKPGPTGKAASKASSKAASKPAAKAGGGKQAGKAAAGKAGRASSGGGRTTAKAGSPTNNASGSSGRAASTKKRAGGSGSSTSRPPTLQPRARKNKKR